MTLQVNWPRVDRAVEVLLDDFARQGGHLSADQVRRTIERRQLSSDEAKAVWAELQAQLPKDAQPTSEEIGFEPSDMKIRRSLPPAVDGLGQYMKEIGKVRLLTAADEVKLKRRIEAGEAAQADRRSVLPSDPMAERLISEGDPSVSTSREAGVAPKP